ncbi:MAG: hypothetical protein IJU51_02170, partial [Clostridia bacterium]|nr:hypothetical protein [Clostridia bacterium]
MTFDGTEETTVNNWLTRSETIDVEPGTWSVSELSVSRYALNSCNYVVKKTSDQSTIESGSADSGVAPIVIPADGEGEVVYENKVSYYDKFSHVDRKINDFGGYKGIRVVYENRVPITGDTAEISKTAFKAYLIKSDGKEVALPADKYSLLKFAYTYNSSTQDDPEFAKDFKDDTTNKKVVITNPSRYANGVYKVKASYKGLSTETVLFFDDHVNSKDRYQKKFIFKADSENKSYFQDGNTQSTEYEYTFTMTKNTESNKYEVTKITHNGVVVPNSNYSSIVSTVNNALKIQSVYNTFALSKWNELEKDQLTYNNLQESAIYGSKDPITLTAVLSDGLTP